jgi:hypothetical protein
MELLMHLTRHLGHLPVPAGPDLVPQPIKASASRRSPGGCSKDVGPIIRRQARSCSPDDMLDKARFQVDVKHVLPMMA